MSVTFIILIFLLAVVTFALYRWKSHTPPKEAHFPTP